MLFSNNVEGCFFNDRTKINENAKNSKTNKTSFVKITSLFLSAKNPF